MVTNKRVLDLEQMSPEHTKLLNEIADKEKRKYTNLIDVFSAKYGESRFWWATTLASRDTLLERGFFSFCIVKLVFELLKRDNYNEIIVPLYSIKKCLEDNLPGTKIVWKGSEKNFKRNIHRAKIEFLKYLCKTMKFRKKFLKNKYIKYELKGKNVFLVDTYDVIGEVSGIKYYDRYFGGLSENTEERIIYFSHPFCESRVDEEKLINIINNKKDRLIYECYFKWMDIFEIFKYWRFCGSIVFNDASVDGIDMKWILEGELKCGESALNSFYGLLKSKAMFRFMKKSGANVKGIIGWYEGQPSSNTLFFEVRRRTNIPTMAYVLTPMFEFNLGLSPSKMQIKMKGTAEYFGIQGEIWEEQIKEYAHDIKIVKAPSFRFQDLFEQLPEKKEGDEIILVLSGLQEVSRDMILTFDKIKMPKKTIKIKNHPANASKGLKDYGIEQKELNNKYEFVHGSMDETLNGVKVAIVSETTSALEILIRGAKVIVWNRSGTLRRSCIPNKILEKQYVKIVYTIDELKMNIEEVYNSKLNEKDLLMIRNESFTDVSIETVNNFLKFLEIAKEV